MPTGNFDTKEHFDEIIQKRANGEYKTKFKGTTGAHLLIGLFEGPDSIYTFDEMRKNYLEMEDLLEYEFAEKYFDGWVHWEKLLANPKVREQIEQWRKELDLKVRSRALQSLMQEASDYQNRGFVQANRYLLDRGYLKKEVEETPKTKRKNPGRSKKVLEPTEEYEPFHLKRIRQDAARVLPPPSKAIN